MRVSGLFSIVLSFLFLPFPLLADNWNPSSPAFNGMLGLNTVPNARMEQTGTTRFHISTLDPYAHINLGIQIAKPLYINLRQTAEISNLNKEADSLYPGLDLKLRLMQETEHLPEIALGLQSATGHKRMAAEYLAFSKRYKSFDFTAGIGWGRMGSAGHFSNPLKEIHPHFANKRAYDGARPNAANNWFTGDKIGLFGGIEYATPIKHLALKADFGADRYAIEQQSSFQVPAAWSVGLNFTPKEWLNIGGAVIGGEKIMAQLSLNRPVQNWPLQKKSLSPAPPLSRIRPTETRLIQSALDAQKEAMRLSGNTLSVSDHHSLPYQIGHAARHIANHTASTKEEIEITPVLYGLHGPSIKLIRSDLERAILHEQGSPQELWQNTSFETSSHYNETSSPFLPERWRIPALTLETKASLAEEESGLLYRTSLIAGTKQHLPFGFLTGSAFRLNIKDNLHRIHEHRPRVLLPVRSNADDFAQNTISLDRLYLSYTKTILPDLHFAVSMGYLEEMYAGLGGEILYRPFGKRFSIGAEIWEAFKRDPNSRLAKNLNGDHLLTGHINAYYEFPHSNMILKARAGRYLGEDIGGTITLSHHFNNGAELEGFVTATNNADYDLFGGTSHLYNGIRLNLPIGSVKHIPKNSSIRIISSPFGRDTGQALTTPIPLYTLTEPFSMRHISNNWNEILE